MVCQSLVTHESLCIDTRRFTRVSETEGAVSESEWVCVQGGEHNIWKNIGVKNARLINERSHTQYAEREREKRQKWPMQTTKIHVEHS